MQLPHRLLFPNQTTWTAKRATPPPNTSPEPENDTHFSIPLSRTRPVWTGVLWRRLNFERNDEMDIIVKIDTDSGTILVDGAREVNRGFARVWSAL